jgi:methylthioribose-1-phosphate isomerase
VATPPPTGYHSAMLVDGHPRRTIWLTEDAGAVEVIDQTLLPHAFVTRRLTSSAEAADAIATMVVRGAPLIGATAAYGMALAAREDASDAGLGRAADRLTASRPTAVNLAWAVQRMLAALRPLPIEVRVPAAYAEAGVIADEDVEACEAIGRHGAPLVRARSGAGTVNVLTHCNAGWLAAVDWGTALAPIYTAHDAGVPIHVWVDETRPRNQGSALTAWELGQHGVPHTVIVDNAGGHLMRMGRVDLCIVGSDRTASNGDVCNKIGTYLKALAAHDTGTPFYVALPSSTVDWSLPSGDDIPIEERDGLEVRRISGRAESGQTAWVDTLPEASAVANFAFDVTPARLVTGLITERGVCAASPEGLRGLFPERFAVAAE